MSKLSHRYRRNTGFTLIEVMVVVLIIGITVSFAVLTISGGDTPAETESRRLKTLLGVVKEEAILQGQNFGLRFDLDNYSFLVLDGEHWVPTAGDTLLRQRAVPDSLRLELEVEGELFFSRDDDEDDDEEKDEEDEEELPQVFFLSSGEVSPFVLTIRPFEGQPYRIEVDETGAVEMIRVQRL